MSRSKAPRLSAAQAIPDTRCPLGHAAARRDRALVSDAPVVAVHVRRGKRRENRVPAFSLPTGIDTNEE
ncbi:hypothetical protein [Sorangium sp. So ce1024]|uniref:hypothetical protein n=1 Tax=Sorangium sp. So ce1024 TaxID=3133327 RepID=UPI003EFD8797